jgi:DNA repair exonuclease SbcCD nuclease subunit
MAQASIPLGHLTGDADHDYFVSKTEIRAAGVQYCALGHWHKVAEYFPGNPFRAWYCGSPETLQFEDGDASGFALEVVLDDVLTATDTGRLARVMGVLEEAAQRLQVLILTCHPERYRGLAGANFVDLEAIVRDAGS